MASTPEGKVKDKVKKILKKYNVWVDWPVPGGFGKSTLDCIGCAGGQFFSIETKAPGKKLTPRQDVIARAMMRSGGRVFVIGSVDDPNLERLDRYLAVYCHRDHYKDDMSDWAVEEEKSDDPCQSDA